MERRLCEDLKGNDGGICRAERARVPAPLGSGYFTSTLPFMLGCRPQM
jgi:hypothetical protein